MSANRRDFEIDGSRGKIAATAWEADEARRVVLLAHGYGEHVGRYDHVARALVAGGAAVYGPDHWGHGRSEGPRACIDDVGVAVEDLERVAAVARREHPGLPVVLLGHSMGGMIATRYAQTHSGALAALVLSGPAIGGNPTIEALLGMDPIPEVPIDPEALSRDPAVGKAYLDDPLVWHGPFQRPMLESMVRAIAEIAAGPGFGALPTLWVHGEEDPLTPLAETREAIERLRGDVLESVVYPGARHEVLNETNRDEVIAAVASFFEQRAP